MTSTLQPLIVERLDATLRQQAARKAEAAAQKKKGRPPAEAPPGWDWLVLQALEGADALEAELGAPDKPPREPGPDLRESRAAAPATEPPGAYLRSITVEGFRGIGPKATLDLTPGPGLTLVVGRNGSGKSSFAEALELLLTGTSYRWEGRTARWKDGWRCLHHATTSVEAELILDGQAGRARAWKTWAAGDELDEGETSLQKHGKKRETLDALNWSKPLDTYRPFLSYSELGGLLESGQASLYDALVTILGLDDLTRAQDVLTAARSTRDKKAKDAQREKDRLTALTMAVDDDRARKAADAIEAGDIDELERLLDGAGGDTEDAALALLQRLAALDGPTKDALTALARELRESHAAREAAAGTLAERSRELADVLDATLHFHVAHGGTECPVCGRKKALDDKWRKEKQEEVRALREAAQAATAARERLERATQQVRRLTLPARDLLARGGEVGVDTAAALKDLDALAAALGDPTRQADALERTTLPASLDAVRTAAADASQKRQDAWRPLHRQLSAWLPAAREGEQAARQAKALKHANDWLKDSDPLLSQAVWEGLRLQSNVSLKDVRLESSGKQRRVDLAVAVDGAPGNALGVMSQGELHALALSLFIPRATQPESPFRFMVVDDPVQSMDPARVDGLARVLHAAAKRRQVLVFTHDDRLPESIRRLGLEATVIEVTRRENSVVDTRPVKDPVSRYFDDAMAVALTDGLPVAAARRVVPGMCRLAIEAACMEVVRKRRLGRGERHVDVEELLEKQHGTKSLMSLALFDDPSRSGDVLGTLDKTRRDYADTFRTVNEGAHVLQSEQMRDTVRGAEKLAAWVRTKN